MAIKKETFSQKDGIIGSYWKITELRILRINGKLTAMWTLQLFEDRSQKVALACKKQFSKTISDAEKVSDLFALGYEVIVAADDSDLLGCAKV